MGLKTNTPGIKNRFDDDQRHCTKKEEAKIKEKSNRESSKFRSDQENHENKPSVENGEKKNEHIKPGDQGSTAATVIEKKKELQPEIRGSRKAYKRK